MLLMTFLHPIFLWLIPVVWLLAGIAFFTFLKKNHATFSFSAFPNKKGNSFKVIFLKILPLFRLIVLSLILIALARPQTINTNEKVKSFGIDMVVAIDVSSSMLAQDFSPNRLEAAKEVASQFITNRPDDRFGLVVFSGESFTQVPITTDHQIVQNQLDKIKNGLIEDGTAIGMGIGTAVNRLKESEAISKVIIIMTDGVNNAGLIDPIIATELAIQYDIKIYTIGVGSQGEAYMPAYQLPNGDIQYDYLPVEIDEELLRKIAKMTNGKYYRAINTKNLASIYNEIDELEKTEIETSQTIEVDEHFYPFAALALLFLFIELIVKNTWLKTFH